MKKKIPTQFVSVALPSVCRSCLGIEMLGVLELFGVELFVLVFAAPLMFYWFKVRFWVSRIAPCIFVPSSKTGI